MKLKKLILHGFKSFADKTEFDFLDGITVIVGPNGCGKSNVVDAVKWVLGEQRPASLRGKEMQDLIFSGTDTRKGVGFAEVSLVLDNSDRSLPIEYAEVVITRRLYKSGESEYLVNGNPVRLRDVRELMMDSGGGPGAFAVMEQGNIDRLLRADPVERRSVFEEAAGIAKYRSRRKETERKLERTAENLARLRDVLGECETRERSLKIQAGKARRFRELSDELKRKRAAGAVARFSDLRRRREAAEGELAAIAAAETAAREALEEAARRAEAERAKQEALRDLVARGEAEMAAVVAEGRASAEKRAAREREAEELLERAEAARRESEEGARRAEELLAELRSAEGERLSSLASLRASEEALAAAESACRACEERLSALRSEREALELSRTEAFAAATAARNAEVRLEAESRSHEGRRARLEERARSSLESQRALEEAAALAAERLSAAEAELKALEERHAAEEAGLRAARQGLEAVSREAARAIGEAAALAARRDLLRKLVKEGEGLAAGTRAVLKAAQEGGLRGVRGLLADHLSGAGRGAARALDQALGGLAEAVVVERTEDAVAAIRWLAEGERGRARFLPLDRLRGADEPLPEALESLALPPEPRALLCAALSRTKLVGGLEEALALSADGAAGFRVVALSGEVVGPEGCVEGGAGIAGLLLRSAELAEIEELLERASRERTDTAKRVDAARAAAAAHEEALGTLLPRLRDARAASREAGEAAAAAEKALAARREEIALETAERAEVERLLAETARDRAAAATRREEAESTLAALEVQGAALQERLTRAARERDEASAALTEARVDAAREKERERAASQRLASLRETLEATRRSAASRGEEARACEARRAACLDELEALRAMFEERERNLRKMAAEVEARRAAAAEVHGRLAESDRLLRDLRAAHESRREELERHRLREAELRMRMEALLDEVRREHGLDLLAEPGSEAEAVDPEQLEREIAEIRDKIDRLGNVNHAALEELQEVEQRLAFLRKEEADLVAADQQLRDTIVRIDEVCVQRFRETFESVRENFREVFRKLFGGGKADLFLENPDDPLGTGIEIVVRPPGKELRNMALLSGGEKTLTTVALLFAFYQTKPPPFCLMDEVDAALDEANTIRMCEMLKEYAARGQFLVITHARPTMTVADTLYGVTMPEAGISRRVSVRFADIEAGRVVGLN
jgi:chromosome segregation protein